MKTSGIILAVLGFIILFSSCNKETVKPSHQITSEIRPVSGFTRINVSDALEVDVIYTPGSEQVVVEANSNLHPYILTEVISGTLFIHRKEHTNIKSGATIHIYVSASVVNTLSVSGASNVKLTNQLLSDNLGVDISGASILTGSVDANYANISLSGASQVSMSGYVNQSIIELSGASSLSSYNLLIDYLDINLSGASQAWLTVNNAMNIKASGASTFNYKGNGVIQDLDLSGGSNVIKN